MRNTTIFPLGCCLLLMLSYAEGLAQPAATYLAGTELKVQNRTLMEHFAPELVLPPEERMRLKKERLITVRRREAVLDTLELPKRTKRRLLKELRHSPFTEEWEKAMDGLYPAASKKEY